MKENENQDLKKLLEYVSNHWPSQLKKEWQVKPEEYAEIVRKVVAEITKDATRGREMVRVTGMSGSGKTTQLVPAAEAYFEKRGVKPVVVAGRVFVPYHPYCSEIVREYGEENLRKMTDDFATVVMFFVMQTIVKMGCDIIVDLALVNPKIEGILIKMLETEKYKSMMLMIVASPEAAEKNLRGREWRHATETEGEFMREIEEALELYAKTQPEMRIVMWNMYDEMPVYDGKIVNSLSVYQKYVAETKCWENDLERLKQAKIKYITE